MLGFGVSWRATGSRGWAQLGTAPRAWLSLGRVFQERPCAPAAVSPRVMALLTHGFLFVIADWWQQLQKQ